MRYIIRLSYDGSDFCGWQIQPRDRSVQGVLQNMLSTILRTEITVTGAGRTDTGVNGVNYVAHFDLDGENAQQDTAALCCKLNAMAPRSLVIHEIAPSPSGEEFHARFGAKKREYHYFIHQCRDPFVEKYSWCCRYGLDLKKMNEACTHLLGEHDFSCFEKTGGNNATSICTVTYARWETYTPDHVRLMGYPVSGDEDYLVFTIRANRFLRNMVRAIVGTLVEVGRGRRDPEWVAELIESGSRSDAGQSVPGNALFFTGAKY